MKYLIFALSIGFASASFANTEKQTTEEYCNIVAKYGEGFEQGRQMEYPKELIYKNILEDSSLGLSKEQIKALGMFLDIAYNMPIGESLEEKEASIKSFKEQVYQVCIEGKK